MKSFVVSLVLIAVILTGAIINNIYLSSAIDEMTEILKSLPDGDSISDIGYASVRERLDSLENIWKKHLTVISLTSNQKYLCSVTLAISNLRQAYVCEEDFDYSSSKEAVILALHILRESQCVSLSGII